MQEVATAVVRRQAQLGGGPMAVSRASWLQGALVLESSVSVPVVAGQTVWAAADPAVGSALIEQPNWFGRIERQPTGSLSVITIQWWNDASIIEEVDVAAPQECGDAAVARNLAGRLRQLPGVSLPHGQPESPWFIVSFPHDAGDVAERLESAGFSGCQSLGSAYPEFPGGMRIQVAWPRTANELFATTVEDAIKQ